MSILIFTLIQKKKLHELKRTESNISFFTMYLWIKDVYYMNISQVLVYENQKNNEINILSVNRGLVDKWIWIILVINVLQLTLLNVLL